MTSAGKLKAVFYGDDFTGSSENLAQFHRSGVKGKLYLSRPSAQTAATDSRSYDVLGFAGTARALSGVELDEELDSAFSIMRTLDSPLIQYKICSTFDSSPTVGSYGAVLARAAAHFGKRDVPVLAATPDFGRYTCFGNHFARFADGIERLDRHPSMSRHPRTPMLEADLRMHLAGQTDKEFVNVTLPAIRNRSAMDERVFKAFQEGARGHFRWARKRGPCGYRRSALGTISRTSDVRACSSRSSATTRRSLGPLGPAIVGGACQDGDCRSRKSTRIVRQLRPANRAPNRCGRSFRVEPCPLGCLQNPVR